MVGGSPFASRSSMGCRAFDGRNMGLSMGPLKIRPIRKASMDDIEVCDNGMCVDLAALLKIV